LEMLYQFVAMVNDYLATVKQEEGQGMVEYALIIVLVSIVAIAALTSMGTSITAIFTTISGTLGG